MFERKADSIELEATNSFNSYQQAVDAAAIISITDKNGIITYVNKLFCQISKYSEEELLGNNHSIINSGYHPKSFFADLWKTILEGNVWNGELRDRAKDGSIYWVNTTISPIFNREGQITHYLSIRNQITEKKELERERESLIAELTNKYNDLLQFNYIVSHNLRAPVTNIISLTDLLNLEVGTEKGNLQELAGMLNESARSIDCVLKDLTKLLAVRNLITATAEDFTLSDIIRLVKTTLSTQIITSQADIQSDISDDANFVHSVKAYFQSIIYNLVNNAIKYKKKNESPVIIIKAGRKGNTLILSVTDNGCGMDLHQVGNKLFGLYQRFNRRYEGRGIGLYLTKTQVEALGGRIEVKSRPSEGTTFTVTLGNVFTVK